MALTRLIPFVAAAALTFGYAPPSQAAGFDQEAVVQVDGRGWGHGHRGRDRWRGPPPRAYYYPPPRYYAPRYYAPPPRVYYPPPAYYAPPPAYYAPAPGVGVYLRF